MQKFTIKTFQHVGLGDQLGTQFARLYLIGTQLNLEYFHTDFDIDRSCKSNYHQKLDGLFLKINIFIITVLPIFSFLLYPSLIAEKLLLKFDKQKSHNLILKNYLGLGGSETATGNVLRVNLCNFIENSKDKAGFLAQISNIPDYKESEILELEWLPEYYAYGYKLDDLFNNGKTIDYCTYLKSKFDGVHSKEASQIKNIAVHIRCGDSVTIKSSYGDINLYGNEITFLDEQNESNIAGDKNRKSLGIDKYQTVLDKIEFPKNTQLTVLTDGYVTSKIILVNYYTRNYSKLSPNKSKIIKEILKTDIDKQLIKVPFSKYKAHFIIGDDLQNLINSIDKLSKADVLIFGTGGFAYYLHSIYRHNKQSYLGHVNEKIEILTERIKEKLNS